jgi:hypothetical protein
MQLVARGGNGAGACFRAGDQPLLHSASSNQVARLLQMHHPMHLIDHRRRLARGGAAIAIVAHATLSANVSRYRSKVAEAIQQPIASSLPGRKRTGP